MDRAEDIPDGCAVLVSACLLGEPCRYDGLSQACEAVLALGATHELVAVCPEQLGGLPTPRTPSEIQPDSRIVDANGEDRTSAFGKGAEASVHIALEHGCTIAVLKSRSPSCGVNEVYDGTFTGSLVAGRGVAASALAKAGIRVIDETELQARWDG